MQPVEISALIDCALLHDLHDFLGRTAAEQGVSVADHAQRDRWLGTPDDAVRTCALAGLAGGPRMSPVC